jgi:hypothetical protein
MTAARMRTALYKALWDLDVGRFRSCTGAHLP